MNIPGMGLDTVPGAAAKDTEEKKDTAAAGEISYHY